MTYYPRPKTRRRRPSGSTGTAACTARACYGLWLLATADGDFAGELRSHPQVVDGVTELEVGYHVRAWPLQGRGYATEAAAACRDYARTALGASRLIAIIHPDNRPSQRVAEDRPAPGEAFPGALAAGEAVICAGAL